MLNVSSASLISLKTETLVIPVCEDEDLHREPTLTSLIQDARKVSHFSGKEAEEVTFFNPKGLKMAQVVVMGLGKREKVTAEKLRKLAGNALKQCILKSAKNVTFAVPEAALDGMHETDPVEALMEGAYLGNHLFDTYKSEKKHQPLNRIGFWMSSRKAGQARSLVAQVEAVCAGTVMAREWVSLPSNDKLPEHLAAMITEAARTRKLKTTLLSEKQLREKKFGALLAVSAGSQSKPCLVVMDHHPKGAKKTVAIVGKGVTFDSGGINLKPGGSFLEDMKMDMAGAAAAAAALMVVADLNPNLRVIGATPLVENMPSGNATRPGDIVSSLSGKTVEIGNTDAEGRLILADTLTYVTRQYKPDVVIDLATLTGACIMALGDKIAGVFSHDDDLAADIVKAGDKTFERCWRLPLPEDYNDLMKSEFADIKNMSSSRFGGAITAAIFLSEFIKDVRWAHIDIAGPAYSKKESAYCRAGGTGFGVRLIWELLKQMEGRG